MLFSVPRFSSISRSIRGTTTAGETAPSTVTHHSGFNTRNAEKQRRKEHITENLKAGW